MAAGSEARKPVGQQVVYLRQRRLGASGAGTFSLGTVPAGSDILRLTSSVRTALNGAPTISIGSRAAPTNLSGAAALHGLTAIGFTNIPVTAGAGSVVDVDTELVAVIAGAPTLGVTDIHVEYIPPDERPA